MPRVGTHLSPRRSIRTRLALVGALLLFVGLAVGGVLFDRSLQRQLSENVDLRLSGQATDRAAAIASGLDPSTQLETSQGERAIAVFDADGEVLAQRGFDDPAAVADVAPGTLDSRTVAIIEVGENEIESTDVRVAAARAGSITVVVAEEQHEIDESLQAVRRLLYFAVPLVALAGGGLLWVMVGRSLRPVEQLRRDAESIAEVGAGGRVQQPEHGDELGQLAATLNSMLERLDNSAGALRRFVSDSSHEIRSPITNIRARIETGHPDDWDALTADLVGEVERIEAIVDDLTYLARSDEGRLEMRPVRLDLDEILFDEAARLQQRGRVTVDASEVEPIACLGDPGQVRRVVRNLVDNAERHARSRVHLATREETDDTGRSMTVLEVDDDGKGIAPNERTRVFERFVRLDESRERATGGTGLGLAIVADIVDRHDGSVTAAEAPLGGARFSVRLPIG